MKSKYCLFIVSLFCVVQLNAQTVLKTSVNSSRVKSLQVKNTSDFIYNSLIDLGGEARLEINFDVIGGDYNRYAYSVVHCNADWTPSHISPMEYMTGFQGLEIEDFGNSSATTTSYMNYRFFLPNQDVQFKLSGNYAVNVFDPSDPDKIILTACFYVAESLVSMDVKISGNTDIDVNRNHQQLELAINHKNLPIPHPLTDLKIYVYQNERRDNCVTDLKPSAILQNQLVYSHDRNLIFKAGNEYRRMEFLSNKYNGMRVENIRFHNPFYHVTLFSDQISNSDSYQYDQDQNGRFFIRCSGCNEPDLESDYHIVHFTLAEDEILGGDIYLNGDAFNNAFAAENRMEYNHESGCYEKSVLLKQGSYNYQYLFVPEGESEGMTYPIEGDFAETENEYTIAVYYRPIGQRYDRLIGFAKASNRMTVF